MKEFGKRIGRVMGTSIVSYFFDSQCSSRCVIVYQIGIIGGTGVGDPNLLKNRIEKEVDTPFGKVTICCMLLQHFTVEIRPEFKSLSTQHNATNHVSF